MDLKRIEKYPNWVYLIFLIIPVVFLYFRVLIGKAFFGDDALYLWYPYRHFAASSLREGIFPLWNPYLLGGAPFQADIQSSILYPFNLFLTPFIYNGMLSSRILQLMTILHVYLGGVFMFFLMKKLLNHKFSAFFCSIIYAMLPQIVYRSVQPLVLHSMIWLPLLFLIVIHLVEKRHWLFSALGGVVVALNLFTGFPHFALMGFSLVSLYIFSYVVKDYFLKKNFKDGIYLILQSITMFAIGIGLFAVQFLPTLEFTEIATRAVGWNYNSATDVSFYPSRLINVLFSRSFGTAFYKSRIFLAHEIWEMAIYFGVLPFIFAVYALLRKKVFSVKFFAIAAIFSLWFALGRYGAAYYLVYLTPVFHKFRCPARFAYIFNFSMIVLSGYGLRDMLTKDLNKKIIKKIAAVFIVASFVIFLFVLVILQRSNNESSNFLKIISFINLIIILLSLCIALKFEELKKLKYLPILLSIFIFIDLFVACFGVFEGRKKPEDYFAKTDPERFLTNRSDEYFRVNTRMKGFPLVLPRSGGIMHKYYTLQGVMPLRLLEYTNLSENLNLAVRFSLYNVRYSVGFVAAGELALLETKDFLPRAKIYYSCFVEKDSNRVFELLNSDKFDYRNIIILKENPTLYNLEYDGKGSVVIDDYNLNSIRLETRSNRTGILFLSEHFYPGWKAYVDNKEEKIIKAFEAFRAVVVPAGVHEIEFIFKPDSFIKGRNISVLTLIFTTILFVFSLIYYKKKR